MLCYVFVPSFCQCPYIVIMLFSNVCIFEMQKGRGQESGPVAEMGSALVEIRREVVVSGVPPWEYCKRKRKRERETGLGIKDGRVAES